MSFLDQRGRSLIGVGVYTVPQAARLVRLPLVSVEMAVGPEPTERTLLRAFPIAIAELDIGFGERVITFQGLMELWVAAQLRDAGVPWPLICWQPRKRSIVLKVRFPFTAGSFRTDGRRVFQSLRENKRLPKTALDLANRQQVFEDVIVALTQPGDRGARRRWPHTQVVSAWHPRPGCSRSGSDVSASL